VSGLLEYLFNQVASDLEGRRGRSGLPGPFDGMRRDLASFFEWADEQIDAAAGALRNARLTATGAAIERIDDVAHGNSLNSNRGTWVYQLVDRTSGEIMKFGITGRPIPEGRYPQWFYEATNTEMQRFSLEPNRGAARGAEFMLCKGYQAATGHLPRLSVVCYAMGGIARRKD
jgi:hypothetical protein